MNKKEMEIFAEVAELIERLNKALYDEMTSSDTPE